VESRFKETDKQVEGEYLGKGRRLVEGIEAENEDMNMIKVLYIHAWKCHNEGPGAVVHVYNLTYSRDRGKKNCSS
jgi:hypothetical protein